MEVEAKPIIKVAALCGSLRKASYNRGLIRSAIEICDKSIPGMAMEEVDISPLPLLNTDLEVGGTFPAPVEAFQRQILEFDSFHFASPEHNYSVSDDPTDRRQPTNNANNQVAQLQPAHGDFNGGQGSHGRRGPMAAFPPGFHFSPYEHELILFYLKVKNAENMRLPFDIINDVELYKYHPEKLIETYKIYGEGEWYFFTRRDVRHGRDRANRKTTDGFWKASGMEVSIEFANEKIGIRKTLVYYTGVAKNSTKTDWTMKEFILCDSEKNQSNRKKVNRWVLCRIKKKHRAKGKKNNSGVTLQNVTSRSEIESNTPAKTTEPMPTENLQPKAPNIQTVGTQCTAFTHLARQVIALQNVTSRSESESNTPAKTTEPMPTANLQPKAPNIQMVGTQCTAFTHLARQVIAFQNVTSRSESESNTPAKTTEPMPTANLQPKAPNIQMVGTQCTAFTHQVIDCNRGLLNPNGYNNEVIKTQMTQPQSTKFMMGSMTALNHHPKDDGRTSQSSSACQSNFTFSTRDQAKGSQLLFPVDGLIKNFGSNILMDSFGHDFAMTPKVSGSFLQRWQDLGEGNSLGRQSISDLAPVSGYSLPQNEDDCLINSLQGFYQNDTSEPSCSLKENNAGQDHAK